MIFHLRKVLTALQKRVENIYHTGDTQKAGLQVSSSRIWTFFGKANPGAPPQIHWVTNSGCGLILMSTKFENHWTRLFNPLLPHHKGLNNSFWMLVGSIHVSVRGLLSTIFFSDFVNFIEGWLLYRILLFSAKYQRESAIGIPLPLEPSSHLAYHPTPPLFFKLILHCILSEVPQSYPTLCDTMDCSLPGSSVHGIFQARILEWVAISFSRRSSRPRDWTWFSRIVGRCITIWATREVYWLNRHSEMGLSFLQ